MSTFDKMIKQYQGNLPDISSTNYQELEAPSLVNAVNDQIDWLTKDMADRTAEAVKIAEDIENNKTDPWKQLAGLVKPAADLQKKLKAKEWANTLYEKATTKNNENIIARKQAQSAANRTEEDLEKKPPYFEAALEKDLTERYTAKDIAWFKKNGYWDDKAGDLKVTQKNIVAVDKYFLKKNELINQAKINKAYREQEAATNEMLDTQYKLALISPTVAGRANNTAVAIKADFLKQGPEIFNALLGVKKYYEGMSRPLSYLDVVSGGVTSEDAMFAGALLQDAFRDLLVANEHLVDQVGENYFIEEIFPKLNDHVQMIHKSMMSSALTAAKERSYLESAEMLGNEISTDGIDAVLNSFKINELTINGSKKNAVAISMTGDLIEKAVDEGYLSWNSLEGIINEPFRHRAGGYTNLETLKPNFYNRLNRIVTQGRNEEIEAVNAAMIGEIDASASDMIAKAAEKGVYPTTEVAITEQNRIAAKYNITPEHPAFAEFKRIASWNGNSPTAIQEQLSRQERNGDLLDRELINAIPENTTMRKHWERKALKIGTGVLTQDEVDSAQKEGEELIKDVKEINDINKRIWARERKAVERIPSWVRQRFQYNMRADGKRDTPETRATALSQTLGDLEEAIHSLKTDDPDPSLFGHVYLNHFEEGAEQSHDQFVQFVKADPKYALETNKYHSPQEEEAMLIAIANQAKGIESLPGYFVDNSKFFKNHDPLSFFKKRLNQTADLRDGKNEPTNIPDTDKYEYRLLMNGNPSDIGKFILKPEHTEQMLDDLKKDDAELNSFFRTTTKDQEAALEGIDNMSLEEILELRTRPNWNDEIGIGLYDLKFSALAQLLTEPGLIDYIGYDAIFNEKTQRKLMYARILQKANKVSSSKTWDNQFRRLKWLDKEEIEQFNKIIEAIRGAENYKEDPYNSINFLSDEVAKAYLEDTMSYGYA